MKRQKITAFSLIELSIVVLIIGILIAGVTSASRLVSEYRITTARTISESSAVPGISDLVLWLDASAQEKIKNTSDSTDIDDSASVGEWIDRSPQNPSLFVFQDGGTGKEPTYIRAGTNNIPTIRFGGDAAGTTGDCLYADFNSNYHSSAYTTFAVVKPSTSISDGVQGAILSSYASNAGYELVLDNTSGTFTFKLNVGDGSAADVGTSGSHTLTNAVVVSSIRTGSSSSDTHTVYLNGTAGTETTAGASSLISSTTPLHVGCSAYGTMADAFGGDISEVILYARKLKTEERQAVEAYLGKKYAITVAQ